MRPPQAPWPVRGVMLDPARLIERHQFYFDLVKRMPGWGLNTLWWHFTDDEGFMLQLRSHPELASPHAFSRAEMKRFLAVAADGGVNVVPEVESLGHTRRITALKRYRALADGDEYGFNAICPSHPRTLPLLEEIIAEVAEVFPGPYFHAGMDEVNLGDCPRCRRRGQGRPKWSVYAEHVKAVHAIIRATGKEMIIWADHVEGEPGMLKVLPKGIILAHWQYTDIRADAIGRSLKAGFRVIGCPALCHWGDVIMPDAENFKNMDAMVETLAAAGSTGVRPVHLGGTGVAPVRARAGRRPAPACVLGVVNTWWTSWRGLRDAYLPAVAYTGAIINSRRGADKAAFCRRFLRQSFGITDASAGAALWRLMQNMPTRQQLHACLFDSVADMVEALRLAESADFRRRGQAASRAAATLKVASSQVKRRQDEFAALLLAGAIAAECFNRATRLALAMAEYRRAKFAHDHARRLQHVLPLLGDVKQTLASMRRALRAVLRAAIAEWDRTRYKDDYRRGLAGAWRGSGDALLVRLDKAERFLAAMTERFQGGVARYGKTAQFPLGV